MTDDPVWITEADVVELVDLATAIDAVERGLGLQASGEARPMDKTHARWGEGNTLHAIGAVFEGLGLAGTKTWVHTAGGATPLLVLWDADDGQLVAIIEAFALGQLRTGSMSGVATRWLASTEAATLAIIGTGKQALAQIAAVAAVRPLRKVSVHSPTAAHREAFADRVRHARPDLEVVVADSVDAATAGATIITTVTRARQPFLTSAMVASGAHVNAVGAITPERAELAPDLVARADVVAVDNEASARHLARELGPVEHALTPLSTIVRGDVGRVASAGLTIFKAMGTGVADLAVGSAVLEEARRLGRGRPLPHPRRVAPHLWETTP